MKIIAVFGIASSLLLGTVVAQTSANSQASQSASQSASASVDKSGAQVNSKNSADAAQSAGISSTGLQAGAANQLQSGSTIHATLVKPVDAHKNRPGDPVFAKTTEDVKSDGRVAIPRGSKIVGHVTEAKAHEKGQAESALGIAFDHAVLKDGSQVPLSLSVQAVGSSATRAGAQAEDESLMTAGAGAGSMSGAASGATRTERGLVGGVSSTTGALVNTGANVGGSATRTASGLGAGTSSSLSSSSQGVIGLRNLSMATSASNSTSGTFTSPNSNVHLDSGTQMILRVQK
jgi:hypothetical protein